MCWNCEPFPSLEEALSGARRATRRLGKVRLLLALALILLAGLLPGAAQAVPEGGYAHPEALIQPEELRAWLGQKDPNLRIVDFRHKAKYYLGHIPGAVQLWRPEIEDRSQSQPGPAAPAEKLQKLLGRLGIDQRSTIVIYSDQCDHTRLWWLLAYYGFPLAQMKLLDGGLEAWKARGYPTQLTYPHYKAATFQFPPQGGMKSLWATMAEVKAALALPTAVVLDVRSEQLFSGQGSKEGAARPGHIPGAVWIFWEEARNNEGPEKGSWKSAAGIKKIYAARGVTPAKDIYLYGHTDLCASYTLVSLYLAGYPLEKLHVYAGSWTEWSRSKEAVATRPAAGANGPAPE